MGLFSTLCATLLPCSMHLPSVACSLPTPEIVNQVMHSKPQLELFLKPLYCLLIFQSQIPTPGAVVKPFSLSKPKCAQSDLGQASTEANL